jgi:hypothetical protein
MKKTLLLAGVLTIAIPLGPAFAWYHAGSWSGSHGSWSASTARGGTASGGDGSWNATGYRGGTASGSDGSWSATGYRGGTASGSGGTAYYHGGYYGAYHAPTVVNAYGAGCYNCGGWNTGGAAVAGLAAGTALGAAAAANSNTQAYNAGVAAGAAAASEYAIGNVFGGLPAGCTYKPHNGQPYYGCANGAWFVPAYGANGVYYRVVAAP